MSNAHHTPDASDDQAPRGDERRQNVLDTRNPSQRADTGLERRRGPGRRRSDFMRAAEEGEMTGEQFLFIQAMDAYKKVNQTPFPTWTEVLEVIRKLGYRKTQSSSLEIPSAEDWTEASNAAAFPPPAHAFNPAEQDAA